jgi:hypothetical protein
VVSAKLVGRNTTECVAIPRANTTGIDSVGDKICLDVDSGTNLATTALDATLEVEYTVVE